MMVIHRIKYQQVGTLPHTIMRLLDRYIARRVFRGYALIMVILASGFSLIALVHELDKVGKGTYATSDAALGVLLTLPGWIVELSPAMALLGAIVGLGELAAGEELIAMQALGVSPGAHCLVGAENRASGDARGYGLAGVRGPEVGPTGF